MYCRDVSEYVQVYRMSFIRFVSMIIIFKHLAECNKSQSKNILACQDIFTLLGSEKSTAKVVDVAVGASVHLYCRFCSEDDSHEAKFWFFKRRGCLDRDPLKEIIIGDKNINNKLYVTADHTLIIKKYSVYTDSGIYSCKTGDGIEGKTFTYVLDGVYNNTAPPFIGVVNEWSTYNQRILNPINGQFETPREEPYTSFGKAFNFSFRIKTAWEPWGECEVTNKTKYIRKKLGKCRLYVILPNISKNKVTYTSDSYIFQYYAIDNYDVSCQSIILNKTLPQISKIVQNIPEFEAIEPCTLYLNIFSGKASGNSEYKYTSIKQIAEHSHITLTCPGVTSESYVEWFKDEILLNYNYRNNMGESEEEPHITIDSYNSLYIFHATKKEEGIYSCTVDGKKILKYEIKVVAKNKLLNDDFFRYLFYLGFVLSLTITCYCAGICVAWHGKTSFADPLNLNKNHYQN